jgi:hypothetical protein
MASSMNGQPALTALRACPSRSAQLAGALSRAQISGIFHAGSAALLAAVSADDPSAAPAGAAAVRNAGRPAPGIARSLLEPSGGIDQGAVPALVQELAPELAPELIPGRVPELVEDAFPGVLEAPPTGAVRSSCSRPGRGGMPAAAAGMPRRTAIAVTALCRPIKASLRLRLSAKCHKLHRGACALHMCARLNTC